MFECIAISPADSGGAIITVSETFIHDCRELPPKTSVLCLRNHIIAAGQFRYSLRALMNVLRHI